MRHPLRLIDAFAERPFAGNPAAVLVLGAPLAEGAMQEVAMELAQAETAFVLPRGDDWEIRWFSPTREVDFCGHATLAAAHALAEGQGARGEVTFHTREVGPLRVRIDGAGRYTLDLPRIDPVPAEIPELPFRVPAARSAFRASEVLCLEVESESDVRAFEPDLNLISQLFEGGFCLTAPGAEADIASRFFWPSYGIPEDQVTGSLHATLVPFWAARLGRDRLTAVQASRRGGRLDCRLEAARVLLTGPAVTTLEGEIVLPD